MSAGDFRIQRHQVPLQLELEAIGGHPTWELGTKFRSSGRALHALNC